MYILIAAAAGLAASMIWIKTNFTESKLLFSLLYPPLFYLQFLIKFSPGIINSLLVIYCTGYYLLLLLPFYRLIDINRNKQKNNLILLGAFTIVHLAVSLIVLVITLNA